LLNARTDSLRRGSFKTMLANKRCVIPAEGFYEWREEHGKKQPYFFARKDGKPVMFAGIWDYSDVKGEAVPSFAILTDEPNELVVEKTAGVRTQPSLAARVRRRLLRLLHLRNDSAKVIAASYCRTHWNETLQSLTASS
jgi:hypothetical protein